MARKPKKKTPKPQFVDCPHCKKRVRFLDNHLLRCHVLLEKKKAQASPQPIEILDSVKVHLKKSSRKPSQKVGVRSNRQFTIRTFNHQNMEKREYLQRHDEDTTQAKKERFIKPRTCPKCRKVVYIRLLDHLEYCDQKLFESYSTPKPNTSKQKCPKCGRMKAKLHRHLQHCK